MSGDRNIHSRLWSIRPWHIAVALLSILLIVFGVVRVTRRVKLHNRIEVVRAAGYPVTPAELNTWHRTPVSGENAADHVMEALARLQMPQERDKEQIPLLGEPSLPPRTQPLDGQTTSTIGKLLDDNAEALNLVEQATLVKYSRYTVDFTQGDNMRIPHMDKFRDMAGLLCLKAALLAEQTETGPAVDAMACAYRLADTLAEESMLTSHMIRIVCLLKATATLERILNRTTVDTGHLEHLEQALTSAYDPNALERAFVSEQCFMLADSRPRMDWAPVRPSESLSFVRLQMARVSGALDLAKIRYIDLIDRHITAARLPTRERMRAASEIEREIRRMRDNQVFLTGIMPDFHGLIVFDVANTAQLLTARTALAVERYRLATGQLPSRLADLVPTYLEQVPQDPFDGQSLRYHRLEKGYVVYSVGRDLSDDGGKERAPVQIGRAEPGYDIAFTMER